MRSLHTSLAASVLCEECGLSALIDSVGNINEVRFCSFCGARVDTDNEIPSAIAPTVARLRALGERTLERLDSLCDKTKAPMHDAITAELLLSREYFRAVLKSEPDPVPLPEPAPRPGMYRIVNGDNFGGDYPNETFVNVPLTNKMNAEAIAREINKAFCFYDNAPRFWRIVEDGYKLQPGFTP